MLSFKKVWFVCLLFLVGCGAAEVEVTDAVADISYESAEMVEEAMDDAGYEVVEVIEEVDVAAEVSASDGEASNLAPIKTSSSAARQTNRLIIKDGLMELLVMDVDRTADNAISIVDGLGGYIISQNIYTGNNGYRNAKIKFGIPVEDFESVLSTFRNLGTVTNETASGKDVTDEFVDLSSKLKNLHATQERLRSFLEESDDIEETLKINDRLMWVEEEIGIIQGRINYLEDRASFSTLTLDILPIIPTATPSPTPTATPIPTVSAWRPGHTAQVAAIELQEGAQKTADSLIYTTIICGPWIILLALFGFLFFRLWRRFGGPTSFTRRPAPPRKMREPTATKADPTDE